MAQVLKSTKANITREQRRKPSGTGMILRAHTQRSMKETTATRRPVLQMPACAASRAATTRWSKSCARPLPAASSPPTAIAPSKACAFVEEAIRSGLRFRRGFLQRVGAEPARQAAAAARQHRSKRCCFPTSCLPAPCPAKLRKAWRRWCAAKEFSLDDVLAKAQPARCWLIAGVQDPGNLGTILRSAEAFGAGWSGAGRRHRQPVQLESGARFGRIGVSACRSARVKLSDGAGGDAGAQALRLIATSSHKGTPLDQADLTGPLAIFIGSEGAGCPADLLAQMDEVVAIPHRRRWNR